MTIPDEFPAPRPSATPLADVIPEPSILNDFGPDPSQVNSEPESPLKRKPEPRKPPFNLGANKKPRSGVRALTEKDKEKIAGLYVAAAMGTMPFKPEVAQALATAADDCADAWYDLAKENDSVRRILLLIIEGGAWGKVFAAHVPILLALLPKDAFQGLLSSWTVDSDDVGESE